MENDRLKEILEQWIIKADHDLEIVEREIKSSEEPLTEYAIEIRYPDDFFFPDRNELEKAFSDTVRVKNFVMGILNTN